MATEFISNSWLMPTNANAEASRVSNYSLDFDGTSQYLKLDGLSNLLTNQDFTLSLWFKGTGQSTSADSSNMLFSAHGSSTSNILRIGIAKTSGGIYFAATGSSGGVVGSADYDDSNWYHLVITKPYVSGGAAGTVYINGSSIGNTETFNINFESATHYSIGQEYDPTLSAGDFFKGNITEVSIYDYELSATQVTQLYGTGSAIGNPMAITNGRKPVAYYPLGNSAFNGEFLASNGAEQDYVFDFDNLGGTSNDFIDINSLNSNILNSSFTISLWLKKEPKPSYTDNDRILDLTVDANTSLQIICDNSSGKFAINFILSGVSKINQQGFNSWISTSNKWNQIVFTWDGSSYVYYFNGQSVSSTGTVSVGVAGTGFFLGKRADGNLTTFYNGQMSNVSVFNTALPATGTESVESLYNYGTPPNIASYSNLQAWWELDASATFDGSNWSIPDASSNSNTGTSSGMTVANLVQSDLIINAPFDSFALDFDGTDDFIDCGNDTSLQFSGSFTISSWVKIDDSGTNTIISKDSNASSGLGYHIDFRSGNAVHAWAYDANDKITFTGLSTGVWYNVVFVFESTGGANGNQSLYINAATPTTGSTTNFASSTVKNLRIGSSEMISGIEMNGKLSNISIYNTNLSATQITTLYNSGKPFDLNTFAVTPVSWWRLGATNSSFDGSNWTILDEISTSGNNGTSANMTQSDLVDGVGATGSATSSGMSSGTNRTGNAPYSDNNAVSYNMSVTAKSTSVPT